VSKKQAKIDETQPDRTKKLRPRQAVFVAEYLKTLNAHKAAIAAGYSPKTAFRSGAQNMQKYAIQAAIEEAMANRAKRTGVTADRVVTELARIAFANMQDFATFDDRGVSLVDSSTLPRAKLAAVAEVSQTVTKDGGSTKFKLHDKLAALEKLGKHLGMFKDADKDGDKDGPVTFRVEIIDKAPDADSDE
jgi:phage terminase small subunit